ncbi:MAG TPA: metalloprotease PmbA [Arenimonas sp.]|nr:metalloprotease PmbA [Arenimonas sp.]
MSLPTPAPDDSLQRLDRLSALAQEVLQRCRARGASQAEVLLNEDLGLSVGVRLGQVETLERNRDRGLAVTVYFGQRKGNASTADLQPGSLEATVEQACAIARHTEADPAAGLADAERMAGEVREFDAWHPWPLDPEAAIALATEAETAGREADPRIGNSEGANLSTGESLSVYANSHGFLGPERGSHHYLGLSLIAGQGEQMQRDYWYTSALAPEDLEAAAAVGRRAAERAVARLSPRPLKTGEYPVLFVPEVARSLLGHLLAAASGGALYRQASFLLGRLGERILPDWFTLSERPHLMRGLRSSSFDSEGVATAESDIVRGGVLERYLLSSYSARKLGMQSTGNAGGVTNLVASANAGGYRELLEGLGRGLVVTELMGQGANTVTGDYSRGAAGFWVENGAIAHPVDEVTIAGRLQDIFLAIEAVGADVDRRSPIGIGSVLVGRMTVAGQG